MPRGGWRGGGRPRIHLDENDVDHRVTAQFLLTPETADLLRQMAELEGLNRSEMIRLLITEAAKARDLKPGKLPSPEAL